MDSATCCCQGFISTPAGMHKRKKRFKRKDLRAMCLLKTPMTTNDNCGDFRH